MLLFSLFSLLSIAASENEVITEEGSAKITSLDHVRVNRVKDLVRPTALYFSCLVGMSSSYHLVMLPGVIFFYRKDRWSCLG